MSEAEYHSIPKVAAPHRCIKCGNIPVGYMEGELFCVDCIGEWEPGVGQDFSCITVRSKSSEEAWELWNRVNRPV